MPLSLPRLTNRLATGLGDEVLLIVGFEGETEVDGDSLGMLDVAYVGYVEAYLE